MAKTKLPESEVWCPRCKTVMGKISRIEIGDGHFQYVTEPKKLPKYCSMCEGVVVRK